MSIRAKSLILSFASAAMLAGLPAALPTGWLARAAAAGFPVATDFRIGGDENQTRFVVDLSAKIGLRAFTLADPYRVVVDLPQVTFQLKPKAGESGRGLINAFRFGLVMQGGSRIVLDLKKPVRIDKAFMLDAAEGQPARLVIDLAAVDRETFLRTIAQENRGPPQAQQRKSDQDASKDAGDPPPLIVLDPGHGGIDNGTQAPSGENEKALVLGFALSLRDKIEKLGKYRVVMTRTDDVFVPLAERVRLARQRQASLFISIHADALGRGDGDAQGATVYTLSETASDAEAHRLAEAENKADVIGGVDLSSEPGDVADILIDLAQRETKTFSNHFARNLVSEIKAVARMHKSPLKSAGFRVLRAADVPSVLLELGYVSNRQDLKQLTSEAWRLRTADAVVAAVDAYFSTRIAGSAAAPADQ
jgi:N-acetylmuramoyl-L-alanine amidase